MPKVVDSPDKSTLGGPANRKELRVRDASVSLVQNDIVTALSGERPDQRKEGYENCTHLTTIVLMRSVFRLILLLWPALGVAQEDPPPPPPPPNCSVAEFRTLALEANESKRGPAAMGWLKATGKNCSVDRLILIRNNRVQWMGSADSAAIAGEIDRLIELGLKEDAGTLGQLYRSPEPPPSAKP